MKNSYARSQIVIHWLVLILIVVAYAAINLKGFAAKGSPERATMSLIHYTAGFSVLFLMVIRVVLKMRNSDPDILPAPPRWQVIASKSLHGLLYLMFIALPVLGVASLWFGQVAWSFFGLPLPVAATQNVGMQHSLKELHEIIANAGYYLVGLHAAAALFHHYVVRDNTLERMLPAMRVKKSVK
ncbi:cytochrome b561 [Enterobacter sp. LM3]|uniref:cytochrome b561 n=1 Tax=Enterobacter sp. LM3 TaxID=3384450 RepID=UPI0039875A95